MKAIEREPVEVLLVEDSLSDIELTMEAMTKTDLWQNLTVVRDGEEAMAYLRRTGKYEDASRPQLVLLDLNLPRKTGREVLTEVKEDPDLRRIPIVVLTTSQSLEDIHESYEHHANCYLVKPSSIDEFDHMVRSIEDFWLTLAKLPSR